MAAPMEVIVRALVNILENPPTLLKSVTALAAQNPCANDLAFGLCAVAKYAANMENAQLVLRQMTQALINRSPLTIESILGAAGKDERDLLLQGDKVLNVKKADRRLRTRQFYTQKRFNLAVEEPEGYAKMFVILFAAERDDAVSVDVVRQFLSVVATFHIDVNRAVGAVLTLGARQMLKVRGVPSGDPHALGTEDVSLSPVLRALLDEVPRPHLSAVLGAHLLHLQSEPPASAASRESVLLLVFALIREERIVTEEIIPYLGVEELRKSFAAFEEKMKDVAKHGKPIGWDMDGRILQAKNTSSQRDVFGLVPDAENGPCHGTTSAAMDLLYLFVRRMRWEDAKNLLAAMSGPDGFLDVAAHPPVAEVLINLAFASIQPALRKDLPEYYSEGDAKMSEEGPGFLTPVSSGKELFGSGRGEMIREVLLCLGPHARRSPPLLFALCRLMDLQSLSEATKSVMKEVLLPSLSLTQSNSTLSNIIWAVLRKWEHPLRWELYGYLKYEVPLQCAGSAVAGARVAYETKSILKRLTMDNFRQYQKIFAKISHGQALTVFRCVVSRTQGYPMNQKVLQPFIDVMKSCSSLSFDMLVYTLLDQFASDVRERMKDDGENFQGWFASTCLILGMALRRLRIPSETITGCVHFIFSKIVKEEDITCISVLKDIILCVTDIDVERNLTTRQQCAQTGGPALISAVMGPMETLVDTGPKGSASPGNILDSRRERERTGSVQALKRAFFGSNLHTHISLAILQLVSRLSFDSDIKRQPLKINGVIHDRTRTALSQLSKMIEDMNGLESSRSSDNCDFWEPFRRIGISKMVKELRIMAPDALMFLKPILKFGKKNDHAMDTSKDSSKNDSAKTDEWQSETLPAAVQSLLAPDLYRAFWTLSLGDLEVPEGLYASEDSRIRKAVSDWEKWIRQNNRRGDRKTVIRVEAELAHFKKVLAKLETERKELIANKSAVQTQLRSEKDTFQVGVLKQDEATREAAAIQFLQRCILPRAVASENDALYCSMFVLMMLKMDISALDIPIFFSLLVKHTPILLLSCTEKDIAGFGTFLKECLVTLEKWRSNKTLFEKEACKTPMFGFRKRTQTEAKGEPWRHDEFCEYLFNLHKALTAGVCKVLKSQEYLHARNTLTLLNIVSEVYPKLTDHAVAITEVVAKLKASKKSDLKLAAIGVYSKLQSGQAKRIPEHFFKLKPKTVSASDRKKMDLSTPKKDKSTTPGAGSSRAPAGSDSGVGKPSVSNQPSGSGGRNTGKRDNAQPSSNRRSSPTRHSGTPARGVKRERSERDDDRLSPDKRRGSMGGAPSSAPNSGRPDRRSPAHGDGQRRPMSARDNKRPRTTPEDMNRGSPDDQGKGNKRQRNDDRQPGNRRNPGGPGRDRNERNDRNNRPRDRSERQDRNQRQERSERDDRNERQERDWRTERRDGRGDRPGSSGRDAMEQRMEREIDGRDRRGQSGGNGRMGPPHGGRNVRGPPRGGFRGEEENWGRGGRGDRAEGPYESREEFRPPPPRRHGDFPSYTEPFNEGYDGRGQRRRGGDERGRGDERGHEGGRNDGRGGRPNNRRTGSGRQGKQRRPDGR